MNIFKIEFQYMFIFTLSKKRINLLRAHQIRPQYTSVGVFLKMILGFCTMVNT